MELTIKTTIPEAMLTRQAAEIAARMSGYQSRIQLRVGDMTVNVKSLMGLLSAALCQGQSVTILCEGEDEAQAVCELSKLLGGI